MIYAKWLVQENIHMHGCNEVMLVWGSLRLVPIMYCFIVNFTALRELPRTAHMQGQ